MMKKQSLLMVATILVGCGHQELTADSGLPAEPPATSSKEVVADPSDSVEHYFAQARLGIGDAYVKMAHFYLDGTLGKPDLLMVMQMGELAEEYKAIPNMAALFKDLPDDDVTKMTFEGLNMLSQTENLDSLSSRAEQLIAMGVPEGYSMLAIMAYKNKDLDRAVAFCDKGIEGGSKLAGITKDIILGGDEYGGDIRPETLLKIADRFPMAYRMLGDYYAEIPTDSATDIPLAMKYYLKASDHACLGRREALWVLEAIYLKGYQTIDSTGIKRLWSLGRNQINDSVIYLP